MHTIKLTLLLTFLAGVSWTIAAPARAGDPVSASNFSSGLNICTAPIGPVTLENPVTVGTGTPASCTQSAVQTALDGGGHINFNCGAAPATIALSSALQVPAGVDTVIDGGGLVTLDGQNSTKILVNPWSPSGNTLVLQNLRFANGRAPIDPDLRDNSGGAITSGSPGTRLHIINTTFANNATGDTAREDNQGGALFSNNSYETVIVDSVFENNTAGSGGAIGGLATGLLIYNSRFSSNQAIDTTAGGIVRGYGGAIHLDGVTNSGNPNSNKVVHICGSVFENNQSVRGGGAIGAVVSDNKGTKATFEKSTFANNVVTGLNGQYGQGGAIYHVEDDHAGGGSEDNLEISQSSFWGNRAGRQGGAVWIYILGNGRVVNSTFESNRTTAGFNQVGQGGAMAITLGAVDVLNSTFANNHADYQAGAIHGGGTSNQISLQNTVFYSNTLNYGQTQPSETRWQGYHTNRAFIDGGANMQYPQYKPLYNNDVNNNVTANPIYLDPLLAQLGDYGGPTRSMALQGGSPAINGGTNSGCPLTDQRGYGRTDAACDIGAVEYGAAQGPVLTGISPSLGGLNQAVDFTLTVTGAEFGPNSIIRWNGVDKTTTYVNSFQLSAVIAGTDISGAGTGDVSVTVFDPDSSTESAVQVFTIVPTLTHVYLPVVLK
jgi:hypothetical protein